MSLNAEIFLVLEEIMLQIIIIINVVVLVLLGSTEGGAQRQSRKYDMISRIPAQVKKLGELTEFNDDDCRNHLRMDRNAFNRFCDLLRNAGGLTDCKYVTVQEKVAMFLSILAHHQKNRVVKLTFKRSGQTVSKHFHSVLKAVLKLHPLLLSKPSAVPEECTDPRWGNFEGCLGALDGTYIPVQAPAIHKARYRNRKGHATVNVLGVCDRDMQFVYVLSGWEGSAADARVLRDAVVRDHGLRVPNGCYYLCDNGYPNVEGFLTPYKGVRYHLNEWSSRMPQTAKEYFNMKHTRARNVIERAFGLLKMRWAILRSPSYYPIQVHNRIILACCLIHNFIRKEMSTDPLENTLDEFLSNQNGTQPSNEQVIGVVQSTPAWNTFRDDLAQHMFNEWMQ